MTGTALVDYARREVTLLDLKGKRFATGSLDDFSASLAPSAAAIPPGAAEALRNMKVDFESKDTGQIASVYGIRAEESAVVMTIGIPVPQGQTLDMRMEMDLWRPLADEMVRVPQLREYAVWSARARGSMDPAELLNRIFAAMPAGSDKLRGAIEGLTKAGDRPPLRMQVAISMPGLANLAGQLRQQGRDVPTGAGFSGNLMEMNWELVEMSTTPLAEDLFTVPPDFRSVAMKDMASTAVAAPAPITPTPEGGVLRVGGGVTAPRLVTKVAPQYSEEMRQARVEGTVVLTIVVGSDGTAHEITVLKSLRPDMDQKAIEAVSRWKFQPGEKDGKPVNVMATVEVNFRLLDTPR